MRRNRHHLAAITACLLQACSAPDGESPTRHRRQPGKPVVHSDKTPEPRGATDAPAASDRGRDQGSSDATVVSSDDDSVPPPAPRPAGTPKMDLGPAPAGYLKAAEVLELLRAWAEAAPDALQVVEYGAIGSYQATYLRIATGATPAEQRPKVLITAATHGDEPLSTATVLGVVHALLSEYGYDDEVTELLDSRSVMVVPMVCPDGYAAGSREVAGGDPNRSFPSPTNPMREPVACAQRLADLFDEQGFKATIDFHASGRMIMYPWSYTRDPLETGLAERYQRLAAEMAELAGYRWGQVPELVGYTAEGSSGDYFHWQGQARAFATAAMAVEVGTAKRPAAAAIGAEVESNVPAVKVFLREAPVLFSESSSYARWFGAVPQPDKEVGASPYFVPGQE